MKKSEVQEGFIKNFKKFEVIYQFATQYFLML